MSEKLPRLNFTKTSIAALQPKATRYEIQDSKIPGLYVRVTPTGVKTFALVRRINGRLERITIGRFPAATPEVARQRAEQLNAEITLGKNPAAIKREARGGVTLRALFEDYLTNTVTGKGTKLAEKSVLQYRYLFRQYLAPMADRQADSLTGDKLKGVHAALSPARANSLRTMVSAMFNHGRKQGLVEANPASSLPHRRVTARDRFIKPDEIDRFLAAVDRNPFKDYWLALLLTGARSGNVLAMRWDEIDLAAGVWQTTTSKTGESLRIVLVPEVVEILTKRRDLDLEWVFPGRKAGNHMTNPKTHWADLLADAGIQNLRVHDLRRTLASYQALGGSSLLIIGKSLGHKDMSATQIYARLTDDPVRQSVQNAVATILKKTS